MTSPVRNESGYFNRNPYNEDISYGETQPRPRQRQQRGPKLVSQPQLDLINRLCDERGITIQTAVAMIGITSPADLTGGRNGTASTLIAALFKVARTDGQGTTSARFEPTEGFYRIDQSVYRVKISKSGNWYAQQCQLPLPGSGRTRLSWEYIGKRVRLDDGVVLTEAEVGQFLKYCVKCGAELTVKESIKRGMGPTCARKSG